MSAKRGTQSPSSRSKAANLSKSLHLCSICEKFILDDNKGQKGQDSIFCEGACQAWLHRGCTGLSKKKFLALKVSNESFSCVSCDLDVHSKELFTLSNDVKSLKEEFATLSQKLVESVNPTASCLRSADGCASLSDSNDSCPPPNSDSNKKLSQSQQSSSIYDHSRKKNFIFFGILESPQGSKFNDRMISDLHTISSACQSLKNPIPSSSIDRLRKYDTNH